MVVKGDGRMDEEWADPVLNQAYDAIEEGTKHARRLLDQIDRLQERLEEVGAERDLARLERDEARDLARSLWQELHEVPDSDMEKGWRTEKQYPWLMMRAEDE